MSKWVYNYVEFINFFRSSVISTEKQTRINGAINVPEVRLIIDETSEQLGVVSIREALARA